MSVPRGYLLVDANGLIDYLAADLSLLTLASQHPGAAHVLSVRLAGERFVGEVRRISR